MYVDAFFNRNDDVIQVIERDSKGQKHFRDFPVKYIFYYPDPKGKYTSIYGDALSKVVCKNTKDFRKELSVHSNKTLFEADINPIFRCLEENYLNVDAPSLNICFFDIETDMQPYAYPSGHKVKIRPKLK